MRNLVFNNTITKLLEGANSSVLDYTNHARITEQVVSSAEL